MIKTTITEITEKFDKEGRVIERITRTEKTDDCTDYETLIGQSNLSGLAWSTTDSISGTPQGVTSLKATQVI